MYHLWILLLPVRQKMDMKKKKKKKKKSCLSSLNGIEVILCMTSIFFIVEANKRYMIVAVFDTLPREREKMDAGLLGYR